MTRWQDAARWLLVTASLVCFGCTHSPVRQPPQLAQAGPPVARGRLATDMESAPVLRIPADPVPSVTLVAAALVQNASPAPPAQAATPAVVPAAGAAQAPAPTPSDLRRLQRQAAQHFASLNSYVARMRRRETVNGKDEPDELMLFKFRKQPWSVYFKWIGTQSHGREVLYVHGQHGGMIHTLLATGDMPLMGAGKHMALAPDNVFVRSASRHAITEAGIGNLINSFGTVLDSMERGERKYGTLRYLGPVKRPEYQAPMEAVEHLIPAGAEAPLPRGGRRWWLFDPASHLPVVIITQDDKGHQVEYYCYDQVQENVPLGDDDFNPAKLWPQSR
ncbi:MAG TPA: DUF1571 domain-containing protein [Gemmataceae bacterium]|jgi:hypothetical protein|nr:DUF1571 domain-containing protein [Gemmataceae bacterium]